MNAIDSILAHTPEQRARFLVLLGYPTTSIIGSLVREYGSLNDAQATEIVTHALAAVAE